MTEDLAMITDDVEVLRAALAERNARIAELELLVKYLQKRPFRTSSESYEGMIPLFNEAEEHLAQEDEKNRFRKAGVRGHIRKIPVRKPLPPELDREIIRHELKEGECSCQACGSHLHEIGVEATEQLDIIPAKLRVLRHERVKYACRACEGGVITASMPKQAIPRSMATPGTLAYIAVSKYADHLPLYRQEAIWKRVGVDFDRTTMASWMIRLGSLVEPLLNLMREDILEHQVVHCDETPLQVLDREKKDTKKTIPKGYMWVLTRAGPGPASIVYEYDASRSGKVAARLFSGFTGTIVTDGFDGYKALSLKGITRAGCWAHARRKFREAMDIEAASVRTTVAHRMMALIRRFYFVEKFLTEVAEEDRRARRQETSSRIMARIEKLLDKSIGIVPPKSATGKALHYLAHEWDALQVFLKNGAVPIDNNRCENAIRPFTLGRKNWLFSATTAGAKASANLYSLIQTALANKLDPAAYLERVFTELPNAVTADDVARLLPYSKH